MSACWRGSAGFTLTATAVTAAPEFTRPCYRRASASARTAPRGSCDRTRSMHALLAVSTQPGSSCLLREHPQPLLAAAGRPARPGVGGRRDLPESGARVAVSHSGHRSILSPLLGLDDQWLA